MSIRFVSHTADVQFIVRASTKPALFRECVKAFFSYAAEGRPRKSHETREVTLEGEDDGALLYQLLEELIYLVDSERFLVSDAKITFGPKKMRALLKGSRLQSSRGFRHVKAPTYAEMYVKRRASGWEAQVVLDV